MGEGNRLLFSDDYILVGKEINKGKLQHRGTSDKHKIKQNKIKWVWLIGRERQKQRASGVRAVLRR